MTNHNKKHGLTVKKIVRLSKPGRYLDAHNLYVQVGPSGTKSWLLRFARGGRERWMGLGPLHTVSLDEARKRAANARLQLLDGIDPLDARQKAAAARKLEESRYLTFAQAAGKYFEKQEAQWTNDKHRQQFINSLRNHAFKKLGHLPVAAIDTPLIFGTLEPIWTKVPETASRVRARIASVLDWAKAAGYRAGDNPASWEIIGKLLPSRAKIARVEHHPAVPYAEIPVFMEQLRACAGVSARALEIAILTAARTGEVLGAR
jgi:hypothetical protein